jgi:crotonobetainyl-CoA:carnitine CoA-transferase CaiB-like acyl-CoA transferase
MAYAFTEDDLERAGHRREGVYPYGYYPCKDGLVLIYGFVPAFWPRIAKWMEMPELLEDPRFTDPRARPDHHGDFDAILMPWLLEQTKEEIFHSAQAHRIPVTPVNTIDDVLKDPQFNARELFMEVEHPVAGKITQPGLPFNLPEAPSQPQQAAPLLGQHNREVYCERLGYTKEDLVRLRERGVI